MKFAHKLIHGGPVQDCYEPLQVLQQWAQCPFATPSTFRGLKPYSVGALKPKKIKNKQTK